MHFVLVCLLLPSDYTCSCPWFLYYMVALIIMRAYRANKEFRFVECIWLHRKSRRIKSFFWGQKKPILL